MNISLDQKHKSLRVLHTNDLYLISILNTLLQKEAMLIEENATN